MDADGSSGANHVPICIRMQNRNLRILNRRR